MPAIFINMLTGKTQEQKDQLVRKITDAAVDALDARPEKVSVFISEYPENNVANNGVMYSQQ
ncbi:MAG: 2-hydroxymuconate tautomerase family protein [Clostridiales bacterium]